MALKWSFMITPARSSLILRVCHCFSTFQIQVMEAQTRLLTEPFFFWLVVLHRTLNYLSSYLTVSRLIPFVPTSFFSVYLRNKLRTETHYELLTFQPKLMVDVGHTRAGGQESAIRFQKLLLFVIIPETKKPACQSFNMKGRKTKR